MPPLVFPSGWIRSILLESPGKADISVLWIICKKLGSSSIFLARLVFFGMVFTDWSVRILGAAVFGRFHLLNRK